MKPPDPATAYARAVVAGEIVTGELVGLAAQRHLADLADGHKRGLRWSLSHCHKVYDWFAFYHHSQGLWKNGSSRDRCTCRTDFDGCPRRLILEPWQHFILGSIFGWIRKHEQHGWIRRFGTAYVQVARKNAKSFLGNGCALYMLQADGEDTPEIYVAATKEGQARYVHDKCKDMVRASPDMRPHFDGWKSRLTNIYTAEGGKYTPLDARAHSQDGFNPHLVLLDELHAHRDGSLRGVLVSGMARPQPLLLEITTAGELRPESPAKMERDYCELILRGDAKADHVFAYIAEPSPKDEWADETTWAKANPNLGVSVFVSGVPNSLEEQCEEAKASPAKRYEFITKRCNLWQDVHMGLFDMEAWRDAPDFDFSTLEGRECYGGLDFAEASDLTAFALTFPPPEEDGIWAVKVYFWLPRDTVNSRKMELRPIAGWVDEGWIEVAGTSLLDYQAVIARILEAGERYDLREIGFDPAKARQFARRLEEDHGFSVVELRQGGLTLGAPTQWLCDLVTARRLAHGHNPVLTWNAAGCKGRTDANNNKVPDKQKSKNRIDGISALVDSIWPALAAKKKRESIYAHRAPVVV